MYGELLIKIEINQEKNISLIIYFTLYNLVLIRSFHDLLSLKMFVNYDIHETIMERKK